MEALFRRHRLAVGVLLAVLLMTPALALFYGGMVRRKNLLSTLTLSYIFMALAGVQWVLYGYSLAFGPDIGGLIGGLNFFGVQRGGGPAQPGLCQDHSPRAFCRLPDDVRGTPWASRGSDRYPKGRD